VYQKLRRESIQLSPGAVSVVITSSSVSHEPAIADVPRSSSAHRILVWGIYLISFGVFAWFLREGWSYYLTPYMERPHHADYRLLRPAGTYGLAYGIAGAAMMILMLIYSLRKRTRIIGRTLPLRNLLDIHIYLGVMGPLLILLHTSFKVQGLVAVSFWSMVAVALSGYFGRYLYMQIPRNIVGDELSLQEIERTNATYTAALTSRFSLDAETIGRTDRLFQSVVINEETGAWTAVAKLLVGDIVRPLTRRRLKRQLGRILLLPKNQFIEFFEISFSRALLRRRIALLSQVQRLFHYWHVIHKPFAIVMYVIMCIHIGVALWTGYAWVR
jgi:hypothetical protein